MQHFMLQSSKYCILQLLLDEEFWGNCVLPIKKSSLFHKNLRTILAFDICTGDLYKRGVGINEKELCDLRPVEFRPIEPRTWDFRPVDFCPMMGRDSQRRFETGQNGASVYGPKFYGPKNKKIPL